MFDRLCIIGVGLIGGSIARTARQRNLVKHITGFGRIEDEPNLQTAKELQVVDDYSLDIATAVQHVDCVIIATPVAAMEGVLLQLKPFWSEQVIYSDVGSVKNSVVTAAERIFGQVPDNLILAHPIAGAEQSGVLASMDQLFVNKRLIITPLENSRSDAVIAIDNFWQQLGSVVYMMDVQHHDSVFAATSHLPHILAFALVNMLGHRDEQSDIFKYAAGGFKDFTRIASSDPTMWRDICGTNKHEIIPLLEQLKGELSRIQHLLEIDDLQQLFETFAYAKNARQRFLDQFEN